MMLKGGPPPARRSAAMRRPATQRAALEHAGQRKAAPRRRRAGRGPWARAGRARRRSSRARRRSADRRRDASAPRRRDRRARSTPVSTNRPPLRYSARPVRPSMSIDLDARRLERLDQRIASHCDNLCSGTRPSLASPRRIAGCRQQSPSGMPSIDQPVRPDRAERLEQQLEDRRRGQRCPFGARGEHVVEAAGPRRIGGREQVRAAPAPARRAGGARRRGRRGRPADCPRRPGSRGQRLGVKRGQGRAVDAQRRRGSAKRRRPRTCAGSRPPAPPSGRRSCRSPRRR